jgi:ribosomal protein S18 acetylase RimI-like enzyme
MFKASATELEIISAQPEQADQVLAIMRGAAAWLQSNGNDQWEFILTDEFPPIVEKWILGKASNFARLNGEIVGAIALMWDDPDVWDERGKDGKAGYIHGLAIRREFAGQGIGEELVRWAIRQCEEREKVCRLDCMGGTKLAKYYENLGFRVVRSMDPPRSRRAWRWMEFGGPMFTVRKAEISDLEAILALGLQKGKQYQEYQPLFHRLADDLNAMSAPYMKHLIESDKEIVLVATEGPEVLGFIHARLVDAPPVYDPGGQVSSIDEFVVRAPDLWPGAGKMLLDEAIARSQAKGAVLGNVVCGPKDTPKRQMLIDAGYDVASEWFVKPIKP